MNQIIAEQVYQNNHKNNKQHPSAGRFFSIFSASAVTLLILFALNIFGILDFNNTNTAYAADSITLSISNSTLAINLFPDDTTGTFSKSSSANISVSTTSTSGYTLSIVGSNDTRNLVGSDTASGNNLSSIASSTTEATFSSNNESDYTVYNNKWGYMPSEYVNYVNDEPVSISNTGANAVFLPGPTTAGDILKVTDCANGATGCSSGADTVSIAIGARANSDMVKGTYANTFVIQATTNVPPKIHMQGINPEWCFASGNIAYDSRDDADYSVATLADGACWMTQNLRLGSDGNQVTLTSADSDVTNQFQFTSSSAWSGTFTSANVNTAKAYYSGDTSLGSYYNWYTATAGTGNSSTAADVEVSGSICPKGWVLPNRAEFAMLLGKYANDSEKLWSPSLPNFIITGYYRDTSYYQNTTHTYAWERTAKSTSSGDNMFIKSAGAKSTDGMNKYYGMPVRCRLGGDKASFTVNFDANGGTGSMASQSTATGSISLNPNTFTRSNFLFSGWSVDRNAAAPTFEDGGTIISYSDVFTLYAVWQQGYPITFTKDSNVSSIDVVDESGTTVGTITSSGQSLVLGQGSTYTLRPTYAPHYAINSITKTTGVGTLTVDGLNADFQVGAGSATVNITSKAVSPMQNYSCSTLASAGSTAYVYDNRDDQLYLIGKLADNKCWMLDNLALDLVAKKSSLTNSNTNASTTTLNYLKNGGGTTSDKYATAAVANWTSSYSYSAPLVNLTYKDVIPTDATSTAGGWKIGGYYNYCAASAGSYCYGNGTSYGTSSGDATEDICPKGWRMPTGKSSGEFSALANIIYGSIYSTSDPTAYANYRNALSLPLSGDFDSGSPSFQGTAGSWWSSTRSDPQYMYRLGVSTNITSGTVNISPAGYESRRYGYSIRCTMSL